MLLLTGSLFSPALVAVHADPTLSTVSRRDNPSWLPSERARTFAVLTVLWIWGVLEEFKQSSGWSYLSSIQDMNCECVNEPLVYQQALKLPVCRYCLYTSVLVTLRIVRSYGFLEHNPPDRLPCIEIEIGKEHGEVNAT